MGDQWRTRLVAEYNKLQKWITDNDPQERNFTVFDDPSFSPSTTASSVSSAATLEEYMSIIVLIYPKTEPFQGRGLRVELRVPRTYPVAMPEVYMMSDIRHPNIEQGTRNYIS